MALGEDIYKLDLKCPNCGFEGGFPQKWVKFRLGSFAMDLLGAVVGHMMLNSQGATGIQDRTFVCPQCGVEIHFPEGIRIYDKLHR